MAVEKVWVRNGVITLAVLLLLFVLAQLALTGTMNVLLALATLGLGNMNATMEFTAMSLFITPAIWLGIAAAMSRHRGIYIALTVLTSLSLLCAIGFLVYEGYVFSTALYYTVAAGSLIQGLMISKLVCWCLITVLLLIYLAVAIAGDCSYARPEFKYMSHYNMPPPAMPMNFMPPDYSRHTKSQPRPFEPSREYPRMVAAPPPVRYSDYGSPRPRY